MTVENLAKWWAEITPGGVGIWTVVAMIAVAVIRQKPIMQKLADAREGNLLRERTRDMRGMRRRIKELESEQRVDRHTILNLEQVIELFLTLTEAEPGRAIEWAGRAREKLAESRSLRATEKAGLYAGGISAENAADEEDLDDGP